MMEIKTGYEIHNKIYNDTTDVEDKNHPYNKKWVAVDDIIKLFEDDSITCFEDLQDIILDLKGE